MRGTRYRCKKCGMNYVEDEDGNAIRERGKKGCWGSKITTNDAAMLLEHGQLRPIEEPEL